MIINHIRDNGIFYYVNNKWTGSRCTGHRLLQTEDLFDEHNCNHRGIWTRIPVAMVLRLHESKYF